MSKVIITSGTKVDVNLLKSYNKVTWVDGVNGPPINAQNLNRIEEAIWEVAGEDNASNFLLTISDALNTEIDNRYNDCSKLSDELDNFETSTKTSLSSIQDTVGNNKTAAETAINTINQNLSNLSDKHDEDVSKLTTSIEDVASNVQTNTEDITSLQTAHATDKQTLQNNIDDLSKNKVDSGSVSLSTSNNVTRDGTKLNITVNTYSRSEINTKLNAKADSNNVYTKDDVESLLEDKANSVDVYSKSVIDTKLSGKANSKDVYTTTQVDTKLASKASSDSVTNLTNRVAALESNNGSGNDVARGPGFYTASHNKSGTTHVFNISDTIQDGTSLLPAVVMFTADYLSSDKIKVTGTTSSGTSINATGNVTLMDGMSAVDGSFVSGTANIVIFSINGTSATMFINSAVSTWAN